MKQLFSHIYSPSLLLSRLYASFTIGVAVLFLGVLSGSHVVAQALKPTLKQDTPQQLQKSPSQDEGLSQTPEKLETTIKKTAPPPISLKGIHARKLFGFVIDAARLQPRAIGKYNRGCLAGGERLAVNGSSWQAMRLSRNRNWGHPKLVALVKRLAREAKANDGWNGLLVGDLSQPRGGPMLTGHASHQIGLDADIWLTPMPSKRLTVKEREVLSATSMLDRTKLSVNKRVWTKNHVKLLKRAASYSEVERIFIHPAIKKAMCQATKGQADRARWMKKLRPWRGHHYHFHIRLKCQGGALCKGQKPVKVDDGCGKELDNWFKILTRKPRARPKPKPKPKPDPKKPRVVKKNLGWLPNQCKLVLFANKSSVKAAYRLSESIPLPVRKMPPETTSVP